MITQREEWNRALDAVVLEILKDGGVTEPPVDAVFVSEALRCPVLIDSTLTERACLRVLPYDEVCINVRPEDREEREQFSVGHELGELYSPRVYRRVADSDVDFLGVDHREHLSNWLGSRLLCPNPWFERCCREWDYNLYELKDRFYTGSNELIARRMLDFSTPTVITIFDNGELHRRWANFENYPSMTDQELQVLGEAKRSAAPKFLKKDQLTIQVWPVYEENWEREIIRMAVDRDWMD